jgi:hypothetical protein
MEARVPVRFTERCILGAAEFDEFLDQDPVLFCVEINGSEAFGDRI